MYDILSSWREIPWAIWYDDRLAGFFTLNHNGKHANQLQLCNWVDSLEMPLRAILSVLPEKSNINLEIPAWRRDVIAMAEAVTESSSIKTSGQYCVLNWKNTLRAFLTLQSQCKTLLDGRVTVLIHGYNGDEKLCIVVKDGQVSVEPFTGTPDKIMSHLDATSYFLAPMCPARQCPVAQNWFPLPVKLFSIDTV